MQNDNDDTVTVIITPHAPVEVDETVEEVAKKLEGAKQNKSKFIRLHTKGGRDCIMCTDVIAFVIRAKMQAAPSAPGVPTNKIIAPPPDFPPKGGRIN